MIKQTPKASNLHTHKIDDYEDQIFLALENDLNLFYETNIANASSSDLWQKRLAKKRNLLIQNNKINKIYFKNFRSSRERLIADTPLANNFIKRLTYRSDIKFAKMQFNKLINNKESTHSKFINNLNQNKFDLIGNPGYVITDNLIYSERYLRHCHYIDLFDNVLGEKISKKNYILFDIGGGYGIFEKFILSKYHNIKPVIVDLPEQLFNASYYLRGNFPGIRINDISSVDHYTKLDDNYFDNYDLCLIPASNFQQVKVEMPIILTNFNSFGEMSNNIFNDYKNSQSYKNLKYLFTLNRIDSFPTYTNNLSILDYELEKYKKLHYKISLLFDYFVVRKQAIRTRTVPFSSRCFEFIGQAF